MQVVVDYSDSWIGLDGRCAVNASDRTSTSVFQLAVISKSGNNRKAIVLLFDEINLPIHNMPMVPSFYMVSLILLNSPCS